MGEPKFHIEEPKINPKFLSLFKKTTRQTCFSFSSLDEISERCKLMEFLEELNQFSPVKDLAHQIPVNGPWDEQIPLVPITVVYNNTLYFIVASVLFTPLELLLPRSLVTSSGPNLKAIIPFICSLTFWLHLTDLIINSVLKSWFKDSVLTPVPPANFPIAPSMTFLGHFFPFFFNSSGQCPLNSSSSVSKLFPL